MKQYFIQSTHKKANANKNKYDDEIVKNVKERRKWLEEERIKQGRNPFEYKDEIEEKHIKVSTTAKKVDITIEITKKQANINTKKNWIYITKKKQERY